MIPEITTLSLSMPNRPGFRPNLFKVMGRRAIFQLSSWGECAHDHKTPTGVHHFNARLMKNTGLWQPTALATNSHQHTSCSRTWPETAETSDAHDSRAGDGHVPSHSDAELGETDASAHWAGWLNLMPCAEALAVKIMTAACALDRSLGKSVEADSANLRQKHKAPSDVRPEE